MRGLVFSLMICFVASCSASARNQEIASTLAAVNAAGSAFASYDASKQQAIVTSATSKALGESALSSWRQTQATVLLVFVSAYRTIALAATANDAQSLQAMVNAATIVTQELQSLGVKL